MLALRWGRSGPRGDAGRPDEPGRALPGDGLPHRPGGARPRPARRRNPRRVAILPTGNGRWPRGATTPGPTTILGDGQGRRAWTVRVFRSCGRMVGPARPSAGGQRGARATSMDGGRLRHLMTEILRWIDPGRAGQDGVIVGEELGPVGCGN